MDSQNAVQTGNNPNTTGASSYNNMTGSAEIEYLKQIHDMTRKQLNWQRASTSAICGMFLVIMISVILILPRVEATLTHVNEVAVQAQESLDEIDLMVKDIQTASQNLNDLVGDNSETLTGAVNNLANIDFDGLNKAISDLQDAVGPLASFFKSFR
ncbi:MAG: hypothetical protein IJ695_07285 [Butyrivibrio sp.]|nr:hypothetical protein [Butyrivibrio sp.]